MRRLNLLLAQKANQKKDLGRAPARLQLREIEQLFYCHYLVCDFFQFRICKARPIHEFKRYVQAFLGQATTFKRFFRIVI